MVLDAAFLNTQHHKDWIKGKVEQLEESSSALLTSWCSSALSTPRCSSYGKGAFGLLLTTVTNLTFYLHVYDIFRRTKFYSCHKPKVLVMMELKASKKRVAQSAGAVEYTDCTSAEG